MFGIRLPRSEVADRYNRAMTRRDLAVLTAVLALLVAASALSLRGPRPLPENAPSGRFSATRAKAVLSGLLAEGVPHPVGTPANRRVRQRLEDRLTGLGYAVEIQRAFVCNATPTCAAVENLFARRPDDEGPYFLLVSHYDSVAAGPGASDAGAPVAAILEAARALGRPKGVAVLITDGEEAGLLGAEAFVQTPMRDGVLAVVNVENRGTSGPAFLFETSRGNAALMPAIRGIRRPYASSLFYTIYDLLPNDTDVTAFKRAGLQALNFAAIGNVAYYHTPLDALEHVDMRTLQHHGDNLVSVTQALMRGAPAATQNAVFFDLFGLGVVSWPEGWTFWLILVSLAFLIAVARRLPPRSIVIGALLTLATVIAAALLGAGAAWIAHLRAGDAGRLAWPQPVITAAWLCGIAAASLAFSLFAARDRRGLFAGAALVWHLGAAGLAFFFPGTAYLLLVPAAAFTIGVFFASRPLVAALIPATASAVLLVPLVMFLYPALGKTSLVPMAVLVALVGTAFAPLLVWRARTIGMTLIVLAVVAAGATLVLPLYTEHAPRREPIEHELPESAIDVAATREGEVLTIRAASRRAADRIMLDIRERGEVLSVNGMAPAPPNRRGRRRGVITVYGAEATVRVRAPAGAELVVTDLTYGLPQEAREKAAARGTAAVTSHRGDVSLSRRRLILP